MYPVPWLLIDRGLIVLLMRTETVRPSPTSLTLNTSHRLRSVRHLTPRPRQPRPTYRCPLQLQAHGLLPCGFFVPQLSALCRYTDSLEVVQETMLNFNASPLCSKKWFKTTSYLCVVVKYSWTDLVQNMHRICILVLNRSDELHIDLSLQYG